MIRERNSDIVLQQILDFSEQITFFYDEQLRSVKRAMTAAVASFGKSTRELEIKHCMAFGYPSPMLMSAIRAKLMSDGFDDRLGDEIQMRVVDYLSEGLVDDVDDAIREFSEWYDKVSSEYDEKMNEFYRDLVNRMEMYKL